MFKLKIKPKPKLVAIGYTSDGKCKKFKIKDDYVLHCNREDLISLTIPKGVKTVYCQDNALTSLDIPASVEYISACDNLLENLTICNNDRFSYSKLTVLNCWSNKLTELILHGCEYLISLHCEYNLLTELIIPNRVSTLACNNNIIENLELYDDFRPSKLENIHCENNKIKNLSKNLVKGLTKGIADKEVSGFHHIDDIKDNDLILK